MRPRVSSPARNQCCSRGTASKYAVVAPLGYPISESNWPPSIFKTTSVEVETAAPVPVSDTVAAGGYLNPMWTDRKKGGGTEAGGVWDMRRCGPAPVFVIHARG